MDKFLSYLAVIEVFAEMVAKTNVFPKPLQDQAVKVLTAANAIKNEAAHPNPSRIWDYFKNHGNLPGTPESRGEV